MSSTTKQILIVDDEPHICLLLKQTLEDLEDKNVKLLTAANGQAALELIEAERPELVLLDIMLPEVNGFDVCRTVKKELKLDNIYIILLTAKGQELDKLQGKDVGADLYMTKPFDPDTVMQKAIKILELDADVTFTSTAI